MLPPLTQPDRGVDSAAPIFQRIGIAGLGLIGGSIALAARKVWPQSQVIAFDNHDVLEAAKRMHAIDVAADELGVLADADLVILSAPVRQNLSLLEQIEREIPGTAVVTDTGSTKRDIVAAARRLPARLSFIGGHPLGGAAAAGLLHARADLFKGRPWLFTPEPEYVVADVLERLLAFARALGSVPQVVDPAAHDRWLAFISHLPQLTASALMDVVGASVGSDGLSIAGRGLIDTTRLASSPPAIWRDIAASNADEIGPALDMLIARLQDLRNDLDNGERLREIFERAVKWREQLPKRG